MPFARSFRSYVLVLFISMPCQVNAADFSVLTYNVFMRWPTWFFRDNHDLRASEMPSFLVGYDAVVLQEAFSRKHRESLVSALQPYYPYSTRVLGEDQVFPMNGGVIILSRWPIMGTDEHLFDGCKGSDCMVRKGVVYAKIDRSGLPVNLFGLHLQAQVGNGDIRRDQLTQVRDFINAQDISVDQLVLVAGDFNIDYLARHSDGEFQLLSELVQLQPGDVEPTPSYDKSRNSLVEEDVKERLDYVFFSDNYRKPASHSNRVLYFRHNGSDLSDHHAVVGEFVMQGLQK